MSGLSFDQIPNSPYALGMVCQFVSRFPPFKNYLFGAMIKNLVYQLETGSHVIAGLDDRIVGYVGWIRTTREIAEAWHRDDTPLKWAFENVNAIAVTVLATEDRRYILPMIKQLKMLNAGHSVYWKRHFISGRVADRVVRRNRAPVQFDPVQDAAAIPLDQIEVSDPRLYQEDIWEPYFARLRCEAPVHWRENGMHGPFWSITRYNDILEVETRHQEFSSEAMLGGITITDPPVEHRRPMFIALDPPKHTEQRRVVAPSFTPTNMAKMAVGIRERVTRILDSLPRNEVFDWVDLVSIEVATQMLATLFDFPFEERRKLTFWSDVATMDIRAGGIVDSFDKRLELQLECLNVMTGLWNERVKQEPRSDLISIMAHSPGTYDLPSRPMEFLGNLVLLIVGGNDTTRNSISGGLWALSQHPNQFRKLRGNPALIPSFAQEAIRWQSPIIHMRRTAIADAELRGKRIRKGDKVVMWYISANRDEEAIERPNEFIIDRAKPRQHLSFGYGIHRCVGARLAELQLAILWEEILKRDMRIEVMDRPKRVYSNFIRGISSLPVRIAG